MTTAEAPQHHNDFFEHTPENDAFVFDHEAVSKEIQTMWKLRGAYEELLKDDDHEIGTQLTDPKTCLHDVAKQQQTLLAEEGIVPHHKGKHKSNVVIKLNSLWEQLTTAHGRLVKVNDHTESLVGELAPLSVYEVDFQTADDGIMYRVRTDEYDGDIPPVEDLLEYVDVFNQIAAKLPPHYQLAGMTSGLSLIEESAEGGTIKAGHALQITSNTMFRELKRCTAVGADLGNTRRKLEYMIGSHLNAAALGIAVETVSYYDTARQIVAEADKSDQAAFLAALAIEEEAGAAVQAMIESLDNWEFGQMAAIQVLEIVEDIAGRPLAAAMERSKLPEVAEPSYVEQGAKTLSKISRGGKAFKGRDDKQRESKGLPTRTEQIINLLRSPNTTVLLPAENEAEGYQPVSKALQQDEVGFAIALTTTKGIDIVQWAKWFDGMSEARIKQLFTDETDRNFGREAAKFATKNRLGTKAGLQAIASRSAALLDAKTQVKVMKEDNSGETTTSFSSTQPFFDETARNYARIALGRINWHIANDTDLQ